MNQRIPNLDKFEQLWNYYTTEGGMNPVQAAGMLGNIYAESRANPGAVNPNDAGPGNDSFGIIQWNRGRRSALETFAKQRGTVANDLLTQAQFSIMEGRGVERSGFNRGMQGQTPEEAALGFAEGYIRPAAQHIPQRAEYGRMFYDQFAGDGSAGPMLAFNPEQAERMSREREQLDAQGGGLTFGPNVPPMGMENPNPEMLMEMAQQGMQPIETPAPQPPMAGPRSGLVEEGAPTVPGPIEGLEVQTAPQLGEAGVEEALPLLGDLPPEQIEQAVDEYFPAAAGETPTSVAMNDMLPDIAEASAYKLGVPVEDAPTTVGEVARAAAPATPTEDETDEEKERKERRRLVAADMLEVLSVGLGQMAAGQAVDLGSTLQNQFNRRAFTQEQEAEEQARQQEQAAAQQLSQQFAQAGRPNLAQLALSGPQGYKAAVSAAETLFTRDAGPTDAFNSMTPEQRYEMLVGAGIDPDTASIGARVPDIGAQMLETVAMPDPEAAGFRAEADALLGAAVPYLSAPGVNAAARRVSVNPTPEGIAALQSAIEDAGGDLPAAPMGQPMVQALAAAAGRPMDDPLVQQAMAGDTAAQSILEEAATKGAVKGAETGAEIAAETAAAAASIEQAIQNKVIPPSLRGVAETEGLEAAFDMQQAMQTEAREQQDRIRVAVNADAFGRAYSNPDARNLFEDVQTTEELNAAIRTANELYGEPDRIKYLERVANDDRLLATEVKLRHAQAGVRLTPTQERILSDTFDQFNIKRQTLDTRAPMIDAMNLLIDTISSQGYDRSEGGPLAPILAQMQNIATDLGLPNDMLQSDPVNFVTRLAEATRGEFFQNFRLAGSGATSDKESTNFEMAMPSNADNAVKQLGMAQRIVRQYTLQKRAMQLEQEYMLMHDGNPTTQLDEAAKDEYIQSQMEQMNYNIFPEVNTQAETWVDDLAEDWDDGNVSSETIVRYVDNNGNANYVMFGDLADQLGISLQ